MSVVTLHQPKPPASGPSPERNRRRHEKLTDTLVATLKPGEIIFDTMLPGFYVQRGPAPTSRPSFRVLADMPARLRTWSTPKTLFRTVGKAGKLPGHFSAKAARRVAQQYIAEIKAGRDPRPKAAAPPGGWTVEEAWHDYRDDFLKKRDRSPATFKAYEYCFGRLKKWHSRPLIDIAGDTLGLKREHKRLTEESGKSAADMTLNFLAIVYKHARGTFPALPEWPSRAVVKHGKHSVAKNGLGPAQLPAWWAEVQRVRNPVKREMLLFIVLSGLRSHDVRTATWENLNEAARTLYLPAPKGHSKSKPRSFYLPVSDAMLACAQRARAAWLATSGHQESPLLFPSAHGRLGHFSDMAAEYTDEDGTLRVVKSGHDLRRTFRNMAVAAHVPSETVARLMNHTLPSVTAGYHDPGSTPLVYRQAMDDISKAVTEALGL